MMMKLFLNLLSYISHLLACFIPNIFFCRYFDAYSSILSFIHFFSDLDGLRKSFMRNAYSSDIAPNYCYLKSDIEKRFVFVGLLLIEQTYIEISS